MNLGNFSDWCVEKIMGERVRYFVIILSVSGRISFSRETPPILLYGYLTHRTTKRHNYSDFIIRQINVEKIKHLKTCKRYPSISLTNQTFQLWFLSYPAVIPPPRKPVTKNKTLSPQNLICRPMLTTTSDWRWLFIESRKGLSLVFGLPVLRPITWPRKSWKTFKEGMKEQGSNRSQKS